MTTKEVIAETVRGVMAMQSKTQKDLAELLGVTRQTAGQYYNGYAVMNTDQIAAVAAWLQVDPGLFFQGLKTEYQSTIALAV